jgi:hypothetical protein
MEISDWFIGESSFLFFEGMESGLDGFDWTSSSINEKYLKFVDQSGAREPMHQSRERGNLVSHIDVIENNRLPRCLSQRNSSDRIMFPNWD